MATAGTRQQEGPLVNTASLVAQATLLALRSSLEGASDVRARDIVILPSSARLSEAEAVQKLMRLPKPVACSAHIEHDQLVIKWRALRHGSMVVLQTEGAEVANLRHAMRSNLRVRDHDPVLLLRGRSGILKLKLSDVAEWWRDYILLNVAFGLVGPDSEARRQRAAGVLNVAAVAGEAWRVEE
jgi:hypothetical protein